MSLKFTILGCGSSGGVPRPALGWGVCDPNNPKNRRRRTSFLAERRAPDASHLSLANRSTNMNKSRRFSSRVFLVAGIYGVVVLLPQYFLEAKLGRDFPPAITHPEHFYGFIGIALAWQFVFLMIARDVQRYRLLMLPAILEKLSFGNAALVLFANGRIAALVAGAGVVGLLLAGVFGVAFCASRSEKPVRGMDGGSAGLPQLTAVVP